MEFLVCFFHLAVGSTRTFVVDFLFVLLAELIEHAKGKFLVSSFKELPNLNLNSIRFQSNFFEDFAKFFVQFSIQLEKSTSAQLKATRLFVIYGSEYLITASQCLIRRCAVKITIFSTLEHETERNTGACCMQIAGERPNVCN